MESLFILSTGAALTLLVWMLLLPFSEFRSVLRPAATLLAALWSGWLRVFGRLALSDSVIPGRHGRFRRLPRRGLHVKRLLLSACTRGGGTSRRPGFGA